MFLRKHLLLSSTLLLFAAPKAQSQQFLTDLLDTTTALGKGYYSVFQRLDQLRFTGYVQPQFQWAEDKGAKNPNTGDFSPYSNNRFMIRRGRLRSDYIVRRESDKQPITHFVFQIDATERGVFVRDLWGRYFENRWSLFSVTAGLVARPFGFEVNYSSADREAPERGRASQILMRTERDLGAMISFEPRGKRLQNLRWLRADLGVFNGQGLIAAGDYDSYKDVIGRIYARPAKGFKNGWRLSGGVSFLYGGLAAPSEKLYTVKGTGSAALMKADTPFRDMAKRQYAGADVQLRIPNGKKGFTEFRAEYIRGLQTGTSSSSETPSSLTNTAGIPVPLYTRPFDAAYFYFLQSLGSPRHQLVLKYDWYDPNTSVSGGDIVAAKGFSGADVRFDTFGGGYIWYASPNLKATLWYDHITNETTGVPGFTGDVKDNLFTARLQYRF